MLTPDHIDTIIGRLTAILAELDAAGAGPAASDIAAAMTKLEKQRRPRSASMGGALRSTA